VDKTGGASGNALGFMARPSLRKGRFAQINERKLRFPSPFPLNSSAARADARAIPRIVNAPFHLCQLDLAPQQRDSETVRVVTRTDVQWGNPIFRAPALPTPHQFSSELPFTVNFRGKDRSRP
jgi:hypothetical protein